MLLVQVRVSLSSNNEISFTYISKEVGFFIILTEHVSNKKQMEAKRTHIINTRKRQLEFLGHIIEKEGVENLILTEQIDDRRDR